MAATRSSSSALLARPARSGACDIILKQTEQVRKAARRFDRSDPETLHDFRVAIRRLRSLLRAYDDVLGDVVSRRTRRTFRDSAHATNASRDIDVQLAWLRQTMETLSETEQCGALWLQRQIATGRRDADDAVTRAVGRDVRRALRRVSRQVRRAQDRGDSPMHATLASATATLVLALGEELAQRLGGVRTFTQHDEMHAARIAGKHLRYVLEPFTGNKTTPGVTGAKTFLAQLKQMQDDLGDLHDTHVFVQCVAGLLEHAASDGARRIAKIIREDTSKDRRAFEDAIARAKRPDPLPGVLTIVERLDAQQRQQYADAAQQWLGVHADAIRRQIGEVASAMQREEIAAARKKSP